MTRSPKNGSAREFMLLEKTYLAFATATGIAMSAGVTAALLYLLISLASAISTRPEFIRLISVVTNYILSAD